MTFRVKPSFQFLYTLPVLLALAILVDALLAPASDKWLFLLLVLALAAISVPRGWSSVTLEGERLTLHTPLRRPRAVDLRRLLAVETSPRVGATLVLRYHSDDQPASRISPARQCLACRRCKIRNLLEERLQQAIGRPATP